MVYVDSFVPPPLCACDLDLVAKRLDDAYGEQTRWWKVANRDYSQKVGRAELFEPRYDQAREVPLPRRMKWTHFEQTRE